MSVCLPACPLCQPAAWMYGWLWPAVWRRVLSDECVQIDLDLNEWILCKLFSMFCFVFFISFHFIASKCHLFHSLSLSLALFLNIYFVFMFFNKDSFKKLVVVSILTKEDKSLQQRLQEELKVFKILLRRSASVSLFSFKLLVNDVRVIQK